MSSCSEIVIGISSQMAPQSAFVEHDQVIQALAANAANQALNMRSLPGRTRSGQHLLDSLPRYVDCCGRVHLSQPRTLPSLKKVFASDPDGTGIDSLGAGLQFSVGRERIPAGVFDF